MSLERRSERRRDVPWWRPDWDNFLEGHHWWTIALVSIPLGWFSFMVVVAYRGLLAASH